MCVFIISSHFRTCAGANEVCVRWNRCQSIGGKFSGFCAVGSSGPGFHVCCAGSIAPQTGMVTRLKCVLFLINKYGCQF